MGIAVATAGDVNGDGYSDIIIGSNLYDNGQADEGRAWLYLGGADLPSAAPVWSIESNQGGARLGVALAGAGDVNGDGYDDMIVGADHFDEGQADEGKVFVYLGSPSGLSTSAAWSAQNDQAFALFGSSVAAAGDVNDDGYDDVLVGAVGYTNGQTAEGAAFVYFGSAAGPSLTYDWMAEGNQASSGFGASLGGAGDVNGDGYDDLIIGARSYDNDQVDEGRVFVYHGSPTGPEASPAWMMEAYEDGAAYGYAVGTAGDVNGDGYSDIIIGTPYWDHQAFLDNGRVSVFLGSPSGLKSTSVWDFIGLQSVNLGASVGTAGDVNGDGYDDIIMGAPLDSYQNNSAGTAIVTYGSATMSAATFTFIDTLVANAHLGSAVSTAGDVNNDGYADILIGASTYTNGQSSEGQAFLHLGSPTGVSTLPAWTVQSDQAGARLGTAIAPAGDVNGDGFADIVVGALDYSNGQLGEGKVWAFYGNRSPGLDRAPRQMTPGGGVDIGLRSWSAADDGFHMRMMGRCAAGRAVVSLDVEARPRGTYFSGTSLQSSPWEDNGAPQTGGSFLPQAVELVGLDAAADIHWRARGVCDSIFFPHSPWVSPSLASRTAVHLRTNGCHDADGDGYGVRPDASCPVPGIADCNDGNGAILPGGFEICDGIDQDCNGVVDDAIPPTGMVDLSVEELTQYQFTLLTWPDVAVATGYDTVRGDLGLLKSSQGDFTAATTLCLTWGYAFPESADEEVPPVGGGFWYAVRPRNCGGAGGYESGSPSQVGLRGPEIVNAPAACP